jgi:hypothetical protein
MEKPNKTPFASQRPGNISGRNGAQDSVQLLEKARADTGTVLKELGSQLDGLSGAEADSPETGRDERDCPWEASIGFDASSGEPQEYPGPPAPGAGRAFLYDRWPACDGSHFRDGNLLDEAILDHEELEERLKAKEKYRKIDEIPFDFVRRRMSVVVEDETGLNTLTSLIIVAAGAYLTVSPLANTLGFISLPSSYWLFLAIMLLGYALLTQVVKTWFIRRFGEWLRRHMKPVAFLAIHFTCPPISTWQFVVGRNVLACH